MPKNLGSSIALATAALLDRLAVGHILLTLAVRTGLGKALFA